MASSYMALVELTDQNFEKEVLRAEIPVLIDFWAPWCVAPDSKISINSRDSIPAGEVSVGQKLLSFVGKRRSSKVLYSSLVSNRGHCKLIKTKSNREIKVTDDHQFWTQDGWRAAQELRQGDKVAVFPSVEFLKLSKNRAIILSEEEIRKASLPRMRVERYIRELRKKNLLPLRVNNEKLPILARLVGLCLTDGSLYHGEKNNYREISFSVGDKKDISSLKNDLARLGFLTHLKEQTTSHEINGRKFKMHTFRVKCLSSALWLLFRAMGVPEGNKTNQGYSLPAWVSKAPRLIQREFLAGFLGGDGPRVTITERKRKSKGSHNKLNINDLEFYKRKDLVDSGLVFAQELSQLMGKFGVKIIKIFVKKAPYRRKDGTQTEIIHIKFRQDFETGYALARGVGYAYCFQKAQIASMVGEFLARILRRRTSWASLYREAVEFEKQQLNPNQIAQKLGLSAGASYGWLRYGRKPKINKHFEKFPAWFEQVRKDLRDGFLWDVVASVESNYLPAVQRIMVNKTHNFIANEFVVHNCGPCRIAEPVIKELAEEYEGKIKIGKLNVDENPKTAQKYGIMSIPTVIIFQGGKEVKKQIGFPGKEGYRKLLEEVLGASD